MYVVKLVIDGVSCPVYSCVEMQDAVMWVSAMAKYAKKLNGVLVIVEDFDKEV